MGIENRVGMQIQETGEKLMERICRAIINQGLKPYQDQPAAVRCVILSEEAYKQAKDDLEGDEGGYRYKWLIVKVDWGRCILESDRLWYVWSKKYKIYESKPLSDIGPTLREAWTIGKESPAYAAWRCLDVRYKVPEFNPWLERCLADYRATDPAYYDSQEPDKRMAAFGEWLWERVRRARAMAMGDQTEFPES